MRTLPFFWILSIRGIIAKRNEPAIMPRILPMLIRGRTDICFCAAKAKPQSIAAAKNRSDDMYFFIN